MSLPKYSEYALNNNNNSGFGHSLTQKNSQKPPGSQQQQRPQNNQNNDQQQPDKQQRSTDKNNSDNSKPDKGKSTDDPQKRTNDKTQPKKNSDSDKQKQQPADKENSKSSRPDDKSKPSNNKSEDPAAKRANKIKNATNSNEKPSTTKPANRGNNPMAKDDIASKRPTESTARPQKTTTIYKAEEYKPKADIPKTGGNLPKVNSMKPVPEYMLNDNNSKGFQHSLGGNTKPKPPPPKPQTVPREPTPPPPPSYSPRPVTEYRRSPTPYYSPPPRRYTPLPPTPRRPSPPPAYNKDKRATYSWLSQPPPKETRSDSQIMTSTGSKYWAPEQSAWPSPPPTTMKFADRSDSRAQQKTPPPMPRGGGGGESQHPTSKPTLEQRILDILGPPRPEQLAPLEQGRGYGYDADADEGIGGALVMHLAQLRNRDDFSFLPDGPNKRPGKDGTTDDAKTDQKLAKIPFPPTAKLDELSGLPPITGLFVDLPVRKFTELAPELGMPPGSKGKNAFGNNMVLNVAPPGTSLADVLTDFPTLHGILLEPPVRTAAEVIPELKAPAKLVTAPSQQSKASPRTESREFSPPPSIVFSHYSDDDDSSLDSPSPTRPDTLPLSPKILGKTDEMLQRGKFPTSILPNARPLPTYQLPHQSATLLPPPKPAPSAVATQTSPSPHLPNQSHLSPLLEQPEIKPPDPNNRPLQQQPSTPGDQVTVIQHYAFITNSLSQILI